MGNRSESLMYELGWAFTACVEAQNPLCISSAMIVTHQSYCKSSVQLIPTRYISKFATVHWAMHTKGVDLFQTHIITIFWNLVISTKSVPRIGRQHTTEKYNWEEKDVLNLPKNFAECWQMTCKQQRYTMSKVKLFVLPKFTADLEGLHRNFSFLVSVSL